MTLPELDFPPLPETGAERMKFAYSRDALGLMEFTMNKIISYLPNRDEVNWLDRQLRRYCAHYFPVLGLFAIERWLVGTAGEFYRLLRNNHSFGIIYTIVVGNIVPPYAVELLMSDMTRRHIEYHHPELRDYLFCLDFEATEEDGEVLVDVLVDEVDEATAAAEAIYTALENDATYNNHFLVYRAVLMSLVEDFRGSIE